MVTFLWRANGSPEPKSMTTSFTDVKSGAYYEKAVAWAVENNVTTGTSSTTFSPDASVTRAQAVTFQWRAAGAPAAEGTNAFADVSASAFYAPAVQWAVNAGVTTGTSDTTFSPNSNWPACADRFLPLPRRQVSGHYLMKKEGTVFPFPLFVFSRERHDVFPFAENKKNLTSEEVRFWWRLLDSNQ